MKTGDLKPGLIVRGSVLPEPVKVITIVPMGDSFKLVGEGMTSGKVHQPILTPEQIQALEASPEKQPFDGDAARFRLGVEAMRLGLAYEYAPYFSLSIARVDPLPHQLEAVYDYFLRLPRIRFLLADDPGAGKTIMAGLLIKELKVRGLIQRILIVTPANLSFQWQRELKDKFRGVVLGRARRRSEVELRVKSLAGHQPVHHLGLLGLPSRGRQGQPDAESVGPYRRR